MFFQKLCLPRSQFIQVNQSYPPYLAKVSLAEPDTTFGFPEVRVGGLPAATAARLHIFFELVKSLLTPLPLVSFIQCQCVTVALRKRISDDDIRWVKGCDNGENRLYYGI